MNTPPFRYEGYQIDPDRGLLTCRYSVGDYRFSEQVTVSGAAPQRWARQDADEAARLVFLLAGVSYYKTAAPPVIDLGETAVTDTERAFLRAFYLDGLAERPPSPPELSLRKPGPGGPWCRSAAASTRSSPSR